MTIIHELLDELILFSILKGEQKTGYQVRKFIDKAFGYPTSFGSIFPHLDRMIEDGMVLRTEETLSVTPRGKVKYNALLDELLLIQSKLTPEIFDMKSITDRIGRLEEFQQRQRDALNPPPKIAEEIEQQKPQKIIFKKVRPLKTTAAKIVSQTVVAKPAVAEEIRNLPGHSIEKIFPEISDLQPRPPPIVAESINYDKLSPEQQRVVHAQDSAEKVAEIPKDILTGRSYSPHPARIQNIRSFNIDRIEEESEDSDDTSRG